MMTSVLALEIGHKITQYALLNDEKLFPANIIEAGTRFFPMMQKMGELSVLINSIMKSLVDLPEPITMVIISFGPDLSLPVAQLKDVIWQLDLLVSQKLSKTRVFFLGAEGRLLDRNQASARVQELVNTTWFTTSQVISTSVPSAVLIDARPSVTDITVIKGHAILNEGRFNSERIRLGELVPIGVTTTPLNAFMKQLPVNGAWLTVNLETPVFIGDVLRQSGDLPEELYPHRLSPDGQGTSIGACRARLARFARLPKELQTPYQMSLLVSYIKQLWFEEILKGLVQILSRKAVQPIERGVAIGPGSSLAVNLFHRVGILHAHDFAQHLNPTRKLASPSIYLAQYVLMRELTSEARK